jgi:hypothetical protein
MIPKPGGNGERPAIRFAMRQNLVVLLCKAKERPDCEGRPRHGRWPVDLNCFWTPITNSSSAIGGRDAVHANTFMQDVAERLATRVQMTTDRDGDEDW